MKKLFLSLILITSTVLSASAVNFWLLWDANPVGDSVTGYYVYEKVGSNYVSIAFSSTNAFRVMNATPGKYTYVVTATNFWGESLYSNEASTPNAPSTPTMIRIVR